MKRDGKGRFIKTDDSNKIIIHFPTIKRILIWIVIIWVLMLKMMKQQKKMGYFLNKCYLFI